MNKKYKIILLLLIVTLAISSYFIIKEFAENKKEIDIYKDLQEVVIEELSNSNEDDKNSNKENNEENINSKYNLENIAKINSDIIGWIKIEGTNIDYPVMQNMQNGDYYLHRNIYKKYSSHGTPYLAENCDTNTSDNLIIYGHHINNSKMFGELENYRKEEYYNSHKIIKLYTLEEKREYALT